MLPCIVGDAGLLGHQANPLGSKEVGGQGGHTWIEYIITSCSC